MREKGASWDGPSIYWYDVSEISDVGEHMGV